jgi:outer membrane biosynthesis protein TonB
VSVKSVSVSDFKVSGMIEHLPAVHMAGARPLVRGGPSILRGDPPSAAGIVNEHGAVRLRPRGRLPEKAVLRIVNANAHEIEQCYNASLRREASLRGRLEIEWIVGRIGTVSKTRVLFDDIGSPALQKCVRDAIRRWVFPPPSGGAALVSFPFQFTNLRR